MIFAIVIHKTHAAYLYPEHAYLGFPYVPMGVPEWVFIVISVLLVAFSLPLNLLRPSGIISFMMYVIVFLPTLVITLATEEAALKKYGVNLSALTAGYLFLLHATQKWGGSDDRNSTGIAGRNYALLFTALLLICAGFLLYAFWDTMNFVGLGGTYAQREAGRSRNLFEAYGQTYLAFVFAPALLSIGLIRKNPLYIALALGGFFLMYSITAERTVFLLPVVMIMSFLVLRSRLSHPTLMLITLMADFCALRVLDHVSRHQHIGQHVVAVLGLQNLLGPGRHALAVPGGFCRVWVHLLEPCSRHCLIRVFAGCIGR